MSGIYIHVPYCKHKCEYCDFYSIVETSTIGQYHSLIVKEIELREAYLPSKHIETIYFGGGTPSLLNVSQIASILSAIKDSFKLVDSPEITIEVNPDDLSYEYLTGLIAIGINRLSIGVQSFSNNDLSKLGRRHNAAQAISSVEQANKAGFSNISIDLIYGLPYSSSKVWKDNLERAFSLPIQHLSCYHLIYEEGTPLTRKVKLKKVLPVGEDDSVKQFNILQQKAKDYGFIHYEISNLAKDGYYSKHNTSYWMQKPYLGLGPSAHSYNGNSREWNPRSIGLWTAGIQGYKLEHEKEFLSEADKLNELILTSLRTVWGLSLKVLGDSFGEEVVNSIIKKSIKYQNTGLIKIENETLRIPPQHFIISDGIIADLFC